MKVLQYVLGKSREMGCFPGFSLWKERVDFVAFRILCRAKWKPFLCLLVSQKEREFAGGEKRFFLFVVAITKILH